MHRFPLARLTGAATLTLLLAACGGGDDSPAAGGAGALTLSATTPAAQATTIDLASATAKGNSARAADAFSSVPCLNPVCCVPGIAPGTKSSRGWPTKSFASYPNCDWAAGFTSQIVPARSTVIIPVGAESIICRNRFSLH